MLRTWLKTEDYFQDVEDEILSEISHDKPNKIHIPKPDSTLPSTSGNTTPAYLYQNFLDITPKTSVPDPPLTKLEQKESEASVDDNKGKGIQFASQSNNTNNNTNTKKGLDKINDDECLEIGTMDSEKWDINIQPSLTRHRIQYSDHDHDSKLPPEPVPFVKLSPFAVHFKEQLIANTKDNEVLLKLAQPILTQLSTDRNENGHNRDRTLSFADAPTPKIPKAKSAKELHLGKISAIEVARQICLLEYDIFKQIKAEEFLKQKSTKQKKKEREQWKISNNSSHNLASDELTKRIEEERKQKSAERKAASLQPNIDKMTDWFNRLVIWTQVEILYQRDSNKRQKALASILKICDALEKYNNISSLCAIRAGLCSAPIHRLTKTWDNIPKKAKETKAKIDGMLICFN